MAGRRRTGAAAEEETWQEVIPWGPYPSTREFFASMRHPFSTTLIFGTLMSWTMIYASLIVPARSFAQFSIASGVLLYLCMVAASINFINRR